jgi:hypothetical protein
VYVFSANTTATRSASQHAARVGASRANLLELDHLLLLLVVMLRLLVVVGQHPLLALVLVLLFLQRPLLLVVVLLLCLVLLLLCLLLCLLLLLLLVVVVLCLVLMMLLLLCLLLLLLCLLVRLCGWYGGGYTCMDIQNEPASGIEVRCAAAHPAPTQHARTYTAATAGAGRLRRLRKRARQTTDSR